MDKKYDKKYNENKYKTITTLYIIIAYSICIYHNSAFIIIVKKCIPRHITINTPSALEGHKKRIKPSFRKQKNESECALVPRWKRIFKSTRRFSGQVNEECNKVRQGCNFTSCDACKTVFKGSH